MNPLLQQLAARSAKDLLHRLGFLRLKPSCILNWSLLPEQLDADLSAYAPGAKLFNHPAGLPVDLPAHSCDLIISNMLPFWQKSAEEILPTFKNILTEQGILLFSCLGPELHLLGDILLKAGFKDPVTDLEHFDIEDKHFDVIFGFAENQIPPPPKEVSIPVENIKRRK